MWRSGNGVPRIERISERVERVENVSERESERVGSRVLVDSYQG